MTSGIGLTLIPSLTYASNRPQDKAQLDKELVYEFVAKAHGDFDTVKSLIEKTPSLLNASHDWGNGDFETALGAASHIGHRPIAEFLIERGARFNIFTAAMLGDLGAIQQLLTKYPKLIDAKGPHGLDLVHHAKAGGEDSKLVLEFLEEQKGSSTLVAKDMPPRKDIAFPSNEKEERAYQMANYIHDQKNIPIGEYVKANFDKDFIDSRGIDKFEAVIQRCIKDMPPASVVLFDGNTKDSSLKMKLQRTDKTTFYYFRFWFNESSPYLINKWMVGGTSAIFNDD